ncbi:unnamed protein product [Owenia fusiformis]|uniref:Tyrosine-protein kinase receptor n=1 Tax=Owenia fusiformis TaxID=6347 RepID=A0A8J1UWF6_OWEFU|nr:unnamed protein product [Owenia fusiformis]
MVTKNVSANVRSFRTSLLDYVPGVMYGITIVAWNKFGHSPPLVAMLTRQKRQKGVPEPAYLIFYDGNKLMRKNLDDILNVPKETMGAANHSIKDIAIHVKTEDVYMVTSDNTVEIISMVTFQHSNLCTTDSTIVSIDVDWINHHLYIAASNKVVQCTLNCTACKVVVERTHGGIRQIKVDPYNGFFYWLQYQKLHRVDLSELPVKKATICPSLSHNSVTEFYVDYTNRRVVFANENNYAMSLNHDGSETSFHANIYNGLSSFSDVTSISMYNDKLIWTNGQEMFTEHYIAKEDKYDHDSFHIKGTFGGINVMHKSQQLNPEITVARNVTVTPTLPTELNITWKEPRVIKGPIEKLAYIVQWVSTGRSGSLTHQQKTNLHEVVIRNLDPGQQYSFKVIAKFNISDSFSSTDMVNGTTFVQPSPIILLNATQTTVDVTWWSSPDNSIKRHSIEYTELSSSGKAIKWISHENGLDKIIFTQNFTQYNTSFTGLKMNTKYAFRITVVFRSVEHYDWPKDTRYNFSTLADRPEAPGIPVFETLRPGIHEVNWTPRYDGGSPIIQYILQYSELGNTNSSWKTVYNGHDPRWVANDLPMDAYYTFRVAAKNLIGWSDFSNNSSAIYTPMAVLAGQELSTTLPWPVVVIGITVAVLVFVAAGIYAVIRSKRNSKQVMHKKTESTNHDIELATLRDLSHVGRTQANPLYITNIIPNEEDIAALPHFPRHLLSLTKFLGRGAFGEVYEGVAQDINGTTGLTNVAVKTLKPGSTEADKDEFLKEALLMSNFRHQHVIHLMGVCLDTDPQYIILELMGGGDLLLFLRSSRPSQNGPGLQLCHLGQICRDVAKGCQYLEEMHYVHRDIAARNCLVSSADVNNMIVKIGDFGLTRDIYKNDYYRKEGEGLLPVKWMSPESIKDGVFTTQSDVWAYGVLMWEVMTLGQQPYPACTNVEVFNFVREGGRLDKPESCPEELYKLMTSCWNSHADMRPSFTRILEILKQYKLKTESQQNGAYRANGQHGSLRLTPTGRKKRLSLLCAEGKKEPAVMEDLLGRTQEPIVGRQKRAVSFDGKSSQSYRKSSKIDDTNYTNMSGNSGSTPKYLKVFDASSPSVFPLIRNSKKKKAQKTGIDYAIVSHNKNCRPEVKATTPPFENLVSDIPTAFNQANRHTTSIEEDNDSPNRLTDARRSSFGKGRRRSRDNKRAVLYAQLAMDDPEQVENQTHMMDHIHKSHEISKMSDMANNNYNNENINDVRSVGNDNYKEPDWKTNVNPIRCDTTSPKQRPTLSCEMTSPKQRPNHLQNVTPQLV